MRHRKKSSTFIVDKSHVHPLIDFAFFQPRNGSLYLKDTCFYDVNQLKHQYDIGKNNAFSYEFARQIKANIESKIKVNKNYSLILMPAILKQYFGSSADVNDEMQRMSRQSKASNRENSLDRKSKKSKASKIVYQTRVLNFLIFVRNNIL